MSELALIFNAKNNLHTLYGVTHIIQAKVVWKIITNKTTNII